MTPAAVAGIGGGAAARCPAGGASAAAWAGEEPGDVRAAAAAGATSEVEQADG
ncbi:MAG: hypothetical protein HC873_18925 [Leptolyngbyaceae cyanobacterium SL_1_1]|nr:hypothetical protein [Leptolyngbyaceae cyanobacterium SL_1_1]